MFHRLFRALVTAIAIVTAGHVGFAQQGRPGPLDRIYSAYAAGDHAIVGKALPRSLDFQHLRLGDRRRLDRWLGAWDRTKAAFVLELVHQSGVVAPAYTLPLLGAGGTYLLRGAETAPAASRNDPVAALWHQVVIGTLQRHQLFLEVERHVDAALRTPVAENADTRGRLLLGRAIAQEQRCWNERPVLLRIGTPIRTTNFAARGAGPSPRSANRPAPTDEVGRRLACLTEAAERFQSASAGTGPATAEALVRLAWMQFQLGDSEDALRSLARVNAGTDSELAYWTALFRGRIEGFLGRYQEAERSYRLALERYPQAQSAGLGLALTLFELDRIPEANDVALSVRNRPDNAPDPWWAYLAGDARLVDRWLDELRRSLK